MTILIAWGDGKFIDQVLLLARKSLIVALWRIKFAHRSIKGVTTAVELIFTSNRKSFICRILNTVSRVSMPLTCLLVAEADWWRILYLIFLDDPFYRCFVIRIRGLLIFPWMIQGGFCLMPALIQDLILGLWFAVFLLGWWYDENIIKIVIVACLLLRPILGNLTCRQRK